MGRRGRIAAGGVRTGDDRGFTWGAVQDRAAGWGHPALRSVARSAVGRGDVGIAPYGGETEIHLLSGGVEPRPYGGQQGVRKKNPPGTASPCQLPLGKGAERTGGRIAAASVRTGFAMTGGFARGAVQIRVGGRVIGGAVG